MSADGTQIGQSRAIQGPVPTGELIDRLSRFQGPPQEFLTNLLAVQCHLAAAAGGAILRPGSEGKPEVLAIFPVMDKGATAPVWLAQAVELAGGVATEGTTAIKPIHGADDMYGQAARQHLVMIPLKGGPEGVRGLAVFIVDHADQEEAHG